MEDKFVLAGREFTSRLIVGTGKYKDADETREAIKRSGAEIVTVAVRRVSPVGRRFDPRRAARGHQAAPEYRRFASPRRKRFARLGWPAKRA